MKKVILTDWPKLKHIPANLRGVETEKLLALRDKMFPLMMMGDTEVAGGYAIEFDAHAVEEELKFRGEK
jgi:hypothetical protein